jgi:hypothetical protein
LLGRDHYPNLLQISSEKNPLNPRFSVLALLPQMTREIQDQHPATERQHSLHHLFPTQISRHRSVKCDAQPAPAHHSSTLECERHLGEEKANRNIRISEIELCSREHTAKQFSNRNKNAFFALSKPLETSEKRS